jgi:hypothetical protein
LYTYEIEKGFIMKKYIYILPILIFASSLLLHPVIAASTNDDTSVVVSVQDAESANASASDSLAPTIADSNNEYMLPYPGILPDHPLYFIKSLRDKLMEMLISDPIKKGQFYLLQSDKYLSMSLVYGGNNKWADSQKMVSTSMVQMEKSITSFKLAKSGATPIAGSDVDRLTRSLDKHAQVITQLISKADIATKQTMEEELEKVSGYKSDVAALQ